MSDWEKAFWTLLRIAGWTGAGVIVALIMLYAIGVYMGATQ